MTTHPPPPAVPNPTRRDRVARSLRARDLASDQRAGTSPRVIARRVQRTWLRRHAAWIATTWLLMALPLLGVWWFLESPFLQGAVLGAWTAGVASLTWSWMVQATGTANIGMGDQAEQWTAQELRRATNGGRVVNHFSLSQREVDHVLVGSAGIAVIETKWSAYAWGDVREGEQRELAAIAQVRRNAQQIGLWHEVKRSRLPVTPVVVLWGGEFSSWPEERRVRVVDGVVVVAGKALRGWIKSWERSAQTADRAAQDQVWEAVDEHIRRREEREPALVDVPASLGDLVTRLASFAVATVLGCYVTLAPSWVDAPWWATLMTGLAATVGSAIGARRYRRFRIPLSGFAIGAALIPGLVGIGFLVSA